MTIEERNIVFAYACIVCGEDSLDNARKALQEIPNAISNERMRVICDEMFSISSRAESIKAKLRAIVEDAVKMG